MEPVEEYRERQRVFVPTRSALPLVPPPPPSMLSPAGAQNSRWSSDHPWRPQGQRPDYLQEPNHHWPVRIAILAVIVALNFFLSTGVLFLVNGVGLIVLLDSLNKVWFGLRGRLPRLRWTTFPAFTGGRLEGVLVARPSPEVIGPVQAVLRCVHDERVEEGGEVCYEPTAIYRQIQELPVEGERLRDVAFKFDIPDDLPGTDLKRPDAVYWQLALRIPVIGPDQELVYLVPIYSQTQD